MWARVATLSAAAFVAAGALLVVSLILPAGAPVGATPALAPTSQTPAPSITRSTMLEDTIELPAGVYRMIIAELVFEPGADTGPHIHPGPSVGYIQDGRIAVSLVGQGGTNTYSSGSAIHHPWNIPHTFRNTTDRPTTMLSFEIFPVGLPISEPAPAE